MGIKISMTGSKLSGNARVLNNATINANVDADIDLSDMVVEDQAVLLEGLRMDTFMEELQEQASLMDTRSSEYRDIQVILNQRTMGREAVVQRIMSHIKEYSQGVLAKVIVECMK